jgi:hypothetical protein
MEDSSVDRGSKTKKVNGKNFRINKYFRKARVRFPMVSLEFFSNIIIPVALWP